MLGFLQTLPGRRGDGDSTLLDLIFIATFLHIIRHDVHCDIFVPKNYVRVDLASKMSKAPVVVGAPETVKCVRRVTLDKETGKVISDEGVKEGTVYRRLDKLRTPVTVFY